jgi:hypothetical protein
MAYRRRVVRAWRCSHAVTGWYSSRFKEIMKGYHDLVDHGRREIYTIEA